MKRGQRLRGRKIEHWRMCFSERQKYRVRGSGFRVQEQMLLSSPSPEPRTLTPFMQRGLLKLMGLQLRGFFRRMFRGAKSPRGAVFLIVGVVIFFMWFAGTLTNAFLMPRAHPSDVLSYFPLAMLGFCIMTLVTTA